MCQLRRSLQHAHVAITMPPALPTTVFDSSSLGKPIQMMVGDDDIDEETGYSSTIRSNRFLLQNNENAEEDHHHQKLYCSIIGCKKYYPHEHIGKIDGKTHIASFAKSRKENGEEALAPNTFVKF